MLIILKFAKQLFLQIFHLLRRSRTCFRSRIGVYSRPRKLLDALLRILLNFRQFEFAWFLHQQPTMIIFRLLQFECMSSSYSQFYPLFHPRPQQPMFTGKIYRNKPIEIDQKTYQPEFAQTHQPLRRVMSNTLMQTFSSQMDILNNANNEEIYEDRDRNLWGNAREYVERCEKRMKERVNAIEKRYNLTLEELQKTVEQKDLVIQLLRQSLQEKEQTIQNLQKDNEMALSSSRMMIQETLSSRR